MAKQWVSEMALLRKLITAEGRFNNGLITGLWRMGENGDRNAAYSDAIRV